MARARGEVIEIYSVDNAGTGFVLNDRRGKRIVSADHVVRGRVTIDNRPGQNDEIIQFRRKPLTLDVSMTRALDIPNVGFDRATAPPRKGETVTIETCRGTITAQAHIRRHRFMAVVGNEDTFVPGDSGSAAVNANGEVFGVVVRRYDNRGTIGEIELITPRKRTSRTNTSS